MRLRSKADDEFKTLLQLFSIDNNSDIEVLKEIKFHLEASQKEVTYFGYRGIVIGVIVAVLTSTVTTQVLPLIFDMSNQIYEQQTVIEILVFSIVVIIITTILFVMVSLLSLQIVYPFFKGDKEIRDQIYINEYMIRVVEEKIKQVSVEK